MTNRQQNPESGHRPVLVAVDGSSASVAAIRYGVHEAQRLGAPLRLLHVLADFMPIAPMYPVLPSDLKETGRAILARAAAVADELSPSVQVSTSLIQGPRVAALARAAREGRLIAFGHERHPALNRLLTGSTVTGVAAVAACPVVVVPPDFAVGEEHHCIVVGIKSTTDSSQLLRRAFEAAAERAAKLVIVHCWELPGEYEALITSSGDIAEWEVSARREIDLAITAGQEAHPEVLVEVRVVHGQAAHTLRAASAEADLILLARRAHAFPIGHLGGTARALLHHSRCPVAVVAPADAPDPEPALVLERDGTLQK